MRRENERQGTVGGHELLLESQAEAPGGEALSHQAYTPDPGVLAVVYTVGQQNGPPLFASGGPLRQNCRPDYLGMFLIAL
jgi:hypothetical protein